MVKRIDFQNSHGGNYSYYGSLHTPFNDICAGLYSSPLFASDFGTSGSFQSLLRVPSRTGHAPVPRKYRCNRYNVRTLSLTLVRKAGHLEGTIIFGDSFRRVASNTPDTGGVNWTGWNSLTSFKDGKRFNLFYVAPARNIIAHRSRAVVLFDVSIFTFNRRWSHVVDCVSRTTHPVTSQLDNFWKSMISNIKNLYIWFIYSLKMIIQIKKETCFKMRYVFDCRIVRMTWVRRWNVEWSARSIR